MKKNLLTLLSVVLMAFSAMALNPQKLPFTVNGIANDGPARAATTNGFDIKFYGTSGLTAYMLTNTDHTTYRCYIYVLPEIATQLAGNELTEISFIAAPIGSLTRPGTIFVSEDIAADPVTSTDITVTNSYQNQTFKVQKHALETPYTIKENTGFYIGYTVQDCRAGSVKDYPVGVDGGPATPFAGTVELYTADGELYGVQPVEEMDMNLAITGITVGEKKAINNLVNVQSVSIGDFSLPITSVTTGNKMSVKMANLGTNKITKVNYTIDVAGGESVTADKTVSLTAGKTTTFQVNMPDFVEGYGTVTFRINTINGEEIDPVEFGCRYIVMSADDAYPRKFVVEEGTGTWCGWCPRGIVGFEYMEENYPDDFIGIAAHNGDAMEVASYAPMWNYITGFPGAMINRDPKFIIDPSSNTLKTNYNKFATKTLGAAKIEVSAQKPADGTIHVETNTTFAIDGEDATFAIAFVILEDGIQGVQQNYYAGGQSGTMGGWEKKGSSVAWTYSHVARDIFNFWGIANSVPTTINKGETYQFAADLPLTNVNDPDKTSIVALLMDTTTGTILNADKVKADKYSTEGITSAMSSDDNAPVEYYNLQGIRMAGDNLPAGIYITRQGNKVNKVLVK